MRSIYFSHIESAGNGGAAFGRMLGIVRCHMVNLVNAINRLQYENAWLEKRELERVLDLAEFSLGKVPEVARAHASERLASARNVALRVQAVAPSPSAEAIAQARSTNWWASRSIWESEQQEWLAQRAARGSLQIASGPDILTPEGTGHT